MIWRNGIHSVNYRLNIYKEVRGPLTLILNETLEIKCRKHVPSARHSLERYVILILCLVSSILNANIRQFAIF